MGSWVIYGLGTENRNLPAFLTLKPGLSHGGAKNWSSGFLPAVYQGTQFRRGETPILDLKPYLSSIAPEALRRGWLAEAEARSGK